MSPALLRTVPEATEATDEVALRLEQLLLGAFGLPHPRAIPRRLGLMAAEWECLRDALAGRDCAGYTPGPTLGQVYRACLQAGLASRYMKAMAGVRFPLAAAGVRWSRRLGAGTAAEDAVHTALRVAHWEKQGLTVQRWVAIAGHEVAWAIAGLLPTGEPLRVAVVVRDEGPLVAGGRALDESLRQDIADDALAEAGFTVVAFRPWQLRYATACAEEIGRVCLGQAPFLRMPASQRVKRRVGEVDGPPVHRLQVAPVALTPRAASPRWSVRESIRRAFPGLDDEEFLARYRAALVASEPDDADDASPYGGWNGRRLAEA